MNRSKIFHTMPRRLQSRVKRRTRYLAPLVTVGVLGTAPLAHADLTTTLIGLGSTNDNVPVDHGSTVEATLAWDTTWDQYADWDGRGDVYQIDERTASILFTPAAANIRLRIDRFQLDEWAGGGDTSSLWSVTGSVSGLLASGNWTPFNSANDPNDLGGRTDISPAALGIAGESLTLAFDHNAGGSISYLAMDNLTFSSIVVPEPLSSSLAVTCLGGLGALAMRRRR